MGDKQSHEEMCIHVLTHQLKMCRDLGYVNKIELNHSSPRITLFLILHQDTFCCCLFADTWHRLSNSAEGDKDQDQLTHFLQMFTTLCTKDSM